MSKLEGLLSRVDRINLRLGVLSGLVSVALIVTIVPDVVSRALFNTSLYGMAETGSLLLVFMAFMGIAGAETRKEHYRVVILDEWLGDGWKARLLVLRTVVGLVTCVLLAWYSTRGAWSSTVRLEASYAVIPFPVWPAKIVVAVAFILLAFQYVADLIRALRVPARRRMT